MIVVVVNVHHASLVLFSPTKVVSQRVIVNLLLLENSLPKQALQNLRIALAALLAQIKVPLLVLSVILAPFHRMEIRNAYIVKVGKCQVKAVQHVSLALLAVFLNLLCKHVEHVHHLLLVQLMGQALAPHARRDMFL
jgi:hypothetical protein